MAWKGRISVKVPPNIVFLIREAVHCSISAKVVLQCFSWTGRYMTSIMDINLFIMEGWQVLDETGYINVAFLQSDVQLRNQGQTVPGAVGSYRLWSGAQQSNHSADPRLWPDHRDTRRGGKQCAGFMCVSGHSCMCFPITERWKGGQEFPGVIISVTCLGPGTIGASGDMADIPPSGIFQESPIKLTAAPWRPRMTCNVHEICPSTIQQILPLQAHPVQVGKFYCPYTPTQQVLIVCRCTSQKSICHMMPDVVKYDWWFLDRFIAFYPIR